MRLSIRYQLLIPLVTLLGGVIAMSTWTAMSAAQAARRRIEKQLNDIAVTASSVTFPRNLQTLRLMKGLSGAEFLLCDGHRRPLLQDNGAPLTTLARVPADLPEPTPISLAELGKPAVVADQVYFCRGVELGPGEGPGTILYVYYPETLLNEVIEQAVRPALIFGGLGSLGAFVLAAVLAHRWTRRLQDLERRTRLIAAGDFSPMPLPARNDELRDLGQSVNDMAVRLAQLQETVLRSERLRLLGQVSGGLAHQLRNAVTGARLALQFHGRECNSGDPEALVVAERQLTLVEMHVKRFLDLGKAAQLQRTPCNLVELLQDAVDLLGPQCKHAGIELRWHMPDELPRADWQMLGDPGQLGHLFVNVLTNAVEAAGPGGAIDVRLQKAPCHRAIIEVRDSGPGPAPQVAERLFEPFVTGKPEGVGLGLAVARQVAQAHGGDITWHREEGKTCFRVTLALEASA